MWLRLLRVRNSNIPVMTMEESRRTQRPYRYGMILLCFGALANWLGLAENYAEPVRYLGVGCIIAGALLICIAMCCWLHTPPRTGSLPQDELNSSVNVITVPTEVRCEKPPDYDTVATIMPPSYDDAIKLNPALFLIPDTSSSLSHANCADFSSSHQTVVTPPPAYDRPLGETVPPNEVPSPVHQYQQPMPLSSTSRLVQVHRNSVRRSISDARPSTAAAPIIR